jgi:hypothetical protein
MLNIHSELHKRIENHSDPKAVYAFAEQNSSGKFVTSLFQKASTFQFHPHECPKLVSLARHTIRVPHSNHV